jgi:hypothetical protein
MSSSSRGALADIVSAVGDDSFVFLFLLDIIMAKARPEPRRIVKHPAPIRTFDGRSDEAWFILNELRYAMLSVGIFSAEFERNELDENQKG